MTMFNRYMVKWPLERSQRYPTLGLQEDGDFHPSGATGEARDETWSFPARQGSKMLGL